ncbi:MAG: hypothetical protein QOE26_3397, partial [Verrucomicrobiota bacterium]
MLYFIVPHVEVENPRILGDVTSFATPAKGAALLGRMSSSALLLLFCFWSRPPRSCPGIARLERRAHPQERQL